MFFLRLLGGATLARDDGTLVIGRATHRHRIALLATLACSRGSRASRDKVMGLLWPESDAVRGRNLLNVSVYELRKTLGEQALLSVGDDLQLNADVVGDDISAFELAVANDDHEAAVALYQGPLLDGFHVDDALDFAQWIDAERARLAASYARALEKLAEGAAARADLSAAVELWRRRAALDPFDSRIAACLMRALDAAGNRAGALQHAALHERILRDEMGVHPSAEVTALTNQLRRETSPADIMMAQAAVGARAEPLALEHTLATAAPQQYETHNGTLARTTRRSRRVPIFSLVLIAAAGSVVVLLGAQRDQTSSQHIVASDTTVTERSVAVLPFVNMSGDTANTYFSDGLSEELISALGNVEGLRVAARTSSFALRDARLDMRTIGDTLGVAAVVEGSVRREGDALRVTAQLVDARTGYQIWSAEYDRQYNDVFSVQDEIAGAIAGALRLRLSGEERTAVTSRPTSNEAYDFYLRGAWFRNRLSREAILKSVEYYDRAIALDPSYARAYAGKATAFGPLLFFRNAAHDSSLAVMRASAQRALALDERLAEAHVAMGIIDFFFDWNWTAAERALRRAIALDPDDAHAHHHLGNYLSGVERLDEALAARERALQLDPLNPRSLITLGSTLLTSGNYERALEQYRRAVDIDSMNPLLLGLGPFLPSGAAEVLERQGRLPEAVDEYVRVAGRRGAGAEELRALRQGFANGGMPGFWRAWLDFETRASGGTPRALRVAAVYARLKNPDRTIEWLRHAYAERDPGFVYVGINPDWRLVRQDRRVVAMLNSMRNNVR